MIILDTHALIWFASDPDKLSKTALQAIEAEIKAKRQILVSSISIWEICQLVSKKRIVFSVSLEQLLKTLDQTKEYKFISVDNKIAYESHILPGEFHADPADRMIVATARVLGAKLVTKDQKIRAYKQVQSVW